MALLATLLTVAVDDQPAQAQITEITVPKDWALIPSGLGPGDSFRLMGLTHGTLQATSRAVRTYNNFVSADVMNNGHAALTNFRDDNDSNTPFDGYNIGGAFNVVGCGHAWSARANTGTQGSGGVPIYWVNGARIADNYADFYDGSWDSTSARSVAGTASFSLETFTGCNNNGTASANPLGGSSVPDLSGRDGTFTHDHMVSTSSSGQGRLNSGSVLVAVTTVEIIDVQVDMWVRQPDGTYRLEKRNKEQSVDTSRTNRNARRSFYAMSPVFTVAGGSVSQGDRQFEQLQFSEQQSEQQSDTSALEASIQERVDLTARRNDNHSNRIWRGALAAVRGEDTPSGAREVDAAFAQRLADGHSRGGRAVLSDLWQDIADTLNGVIPPPPPPPPPPPTTTTTTTLPPPVTPELSITGGSGVTEGQGAVFTITASPAPASQLSVPVNVTQSGDFANVGARTVIIPVNSTSATLWVSTTDDAVDEPDGSVTATLQAGSGYTLGASSAATVAVSDNDDPPPPPTTTTTLPPPPPPPPPPVEAGSLDCDNSGVIVAEMTVAEPTHQFSFATFELELCEQYWGPKYIDYHIAHITTDDNDFFYMPQGTLVIDSFDHTAQIQVMLNADSQTEGDETFALVLERADPASINLGPGRVLGTITDTG